jgi:hypothetical protein
VAVLAALLFGESLGPLGVLGLLLGVLGLGLLEVPQELLLQGPAAIAASAAASGLVLQSGEFYMLLAAQSMALGTVMVRCARPPPCRSMDPMQQHRCSRCSSVPRACPAARALRPASCWLLQPRRLPGAFGTPLPGSWPALAPAALAPTLALPKLRRWVSKHCDSVMATGWHMVLGGGMLLAASVSRDQDLLVQRLAGFDGSDALAMTYVSLLGGSPGWRLPDPACRGPRSQEAGPRLQEAARAGDLSGPPGRQWLCR